MCDDVSTVSSGPALGFTAVVISEQSYSRRPVDGPRHGFVHDAYRETDQHPLTDPADAVRQRHPLSDARDAVVDTGHVGPNEQTHQTAKPQTFDQPTSTLVAFRVDPARKEHPHEYA